MNGGRGQRALILGAVLLVVLAAGAVIVGQGGSHPEQTQSPRSTAADSPQAVLRTPGPTPESTPETTPAPTLVLADPRLRFGLVMNSQVAGELVGSAEIDGWVAGRTVRWYAVSGTGLSGHLLQEALIDGKLLALTADGSWAPGVGVGALDPWRFIDAGASLGALALDASSVRCAVIQAALTPDSLARVFGPDGLPAGASGVAESEPVGADCQLSFHAQWTGVTGPKMEWSRVLTLTPDPAVPPAGAVVAAGFPAPEPAPEPAHGTASAPAVAAGGGQVTFTPYGGIHFENSVAFLHSASLDIAARSGVLDLATGTLTVGLTMHGGAGSLPALQAGSTDFGVSVRQVIVDGSPLDPLPPASEGQCQMVAVASAGTPNCDITLGLPSAPRDSVRIYLEMTGVSDAPEIGHTALWVTLLPER